MAPSRCAQAGASASAGALHVGSRSGEVPPRVAALLDTRVHARILVVVPAVLAVSSIVWTGECIDDPQELLRAVVTP
ncbi:hypothetical protein [Actinophytocola sp.]|uniref:hypothetical protein n=1 Tax=Actinophytocola sp. TaxID=1872138 RepID=UPI0025B7BB3D|nr:hypothetical protein [Actinophytocola sp.]